LKKAGLPTVIRPYQQWPVKNPETSYKMPEKSECRLICKVYKSSTTCIIMHLQALKTDFYKQFSPIFAVQNLI